MIPEPYDAYAVLLLLALAMWAFVSERWRPDVVSLGTLGGLLALGLIAPRDALAIFGNEAPITVAAMFVLSAALERTGVVENLGSMAARIAGGSPRLTLLVVCVGAALVSSVMNNTPVVVVLTPVVIALAQGVGTSPSKYLIPLSYATVLGGCCTLIGTSTNIVASGAAVQAGLEPFSLLEITPLGVPVTLVGILYMMIFAFRLLPDRDTFSSIHDTNRSRQFLAEVLVPLGSPLAGRTVGQSDVARKLGARVVDLIRERISCAAELETLPIQAGDRLVLRTDASDVIGLRDRGDVVFGAGLGHAIEPIAAQNARLVEAIVAPGSRYVGHSLNDLNLRRQYGVYILAVHRRNENLGARLDEVTLRFGDTLLIEGPPEGLKRLFDQHELVAISEPSVTTHRRGRAWLALATLAAVIALSGLEIMPIAALAIIATAVVVIGGCLEPDEALAAVRWPIMLLIFGSLALGKAMETSGAAQLLVDGVMGFAAGMPTLVILALVYLVAMVLTEFISNNAAAILLVPIAVGLAQGLGVDPRPFVVAVMFAASNAFATPIGYQTNTFVYSAGGYKFIDFVRLGVPLNLIAWVAAVLLIPLLWPFHR